MKILFSPCHYIYDEAGGGSEHYWAFNIADRISNIYNNSVVITGFKNIKKEKPYKIIELQPNKKNADLSIKNALVFNFKCFIKTQKILSNNRFDLIHHVLPFSINNTFNLSFLFRVKTHLIIGPVQGPLKFNNKDINISNFRSSKKEFNLLNIFFNFLRFFLFPVLKYFSNLTLKKSDAIIVINEYTKNILVKNGINPQKINIIPPGIDTKAFAYVPFDLKNKGKAELLVVCYLLKRKGVDLVIRSIKEVIRKNNNIILRIVGDGPQKEKLENLARELNLQDYIIFEGFVENDKIQNYYKKAHIFLSMSRDESWGQMYLEAMASGLPVIASKNTGSVEIIKDGEFGYLINQEDWEGLAEKLIFLIKNKGLIYKFGRRARREAEIKYDWDKVIIPKYLNIYENLQNPII